ncbi:hypothetical protein A2U01_0093199, partial [Trifolium medium]|nr:hypothetical protein [Trifolium medium]
SAIICCLVAAPVGFLVDGAVMSAAYVPSNNL